MAIDTEAKRRSTMQTWGFNRVLPVPDGSDADSASQRAHMYIYAGLISVFVPPPWYYWLVIRIRRNSHA